MQQYACQLLRGLKWFVLWEDVEKGYAKYSWEFKYLIECSILNNIFSFKLKL